MEIVTVIRDVIGWGDHVPDVLPVLDLYQNRDKVGTARRIGETADMERQWQGHVLKTFCSRAEITIRAEYAASKSFMIIAQAEGGSPEPRGYCVCPSLNRPPTKWFVSGSSAAAASPTEPRSDS